jgi:hypothetical protein
MRENECAEIGKLAEIASLLRGKVLYRSAPVRAPTGVSRLTPGADEERVLEPLVLHGRIIKRRRPESVQRLDGFWTPGG